MTVSRPALFSAAAAFPLRGAATGRLLSPRSCTHRPGMPKTITTFVAPGAWRLHEPHCLAMKVVGNARRWFAVGDKINVAVPGMGDSITEGELGQWNVAIGESVFVDDVLCEIETDKVQTDVKATFNGTVAAILAQPGDTVTVNQDIITIVEGEGGTEPAKPAPAAAANLPSPPAPIPPAAVESASPTDPSGSHRKPMIQFRYGVRDPAAVKFDGQASGGPLSEYADHVDPMPSAFIRRREIPAEEIELIMVR
eukprot:SAG31_NODE_540_length_14288_cov_51.958066_3_plen_253_part_00